MSQNHHQHGDLATSFLLGALIRQQHDAQRESDFRTIQAGFMQQGYDVETAEDLTEEYFATQEGGGNTPLVYIFDFVMNVALFALLVAAAVGIFNAIFR